MKAQVVSFHCVLKNKLGKVISSTYNQNVITLAGHSAHGLAALAEGLQNLKKGERRSISLSAEQAYGFYDPAKVLEVDRDQVDNHGGFRPGQEIEVDDSNGKTMHLRVVGVRGDKVTLDGNHPLAGQDLVFEIEATEVRNATAEELGDDEGVDINPYGGYLQ